jgi:3-deoxy-D-manno-octulosonic-acid transferase
MKNLLKKIRCFFVQNEESQNLLRSIDITNSKIIGDTRVDRVLSILKQNNTLDVVEKFKANNLCFVVGSSWPEDIALISDTIEQEPEIKTIIAPHLVDEKSLQEVENSFKQPSIRLSSFSKVEQTNANILLIDCIGVLTKIYNYADLAYVGGGMGTDGLHNTLEPAVFGIPIIIGKNYKRYQEALDLVNSGGVVSVKSNLEFNKIFKKILFGTNLAEEMGKRNMEYINKYEGATDVFFEELNHSLNI